MSTEHSPRFIKALLAAQHEHRAAKIYLAGESTPLNSVVLGFDYYEGCILLDGISETPNHRLVQSMQGHPFWLQIRHEDQFLRVECLLDSLQFDLLTLKILRHEFTDNQRWQPRIHFDARRGPAVRMELKNTLPMDGYIKNLSAQGALIEVYGLDLRESFGSHKRWQIALRFNELFEVPLNIELKQFKFKRKPSCHSSLRVVFDKPTCLARTQIENFLEAFQLETNAWQASVRDLLDAIA